MKLRIKKNVLGEEYLLYAELTHEKRECKLRICATEKEYSAIVNDDFTKILLLEPLTLKGYGEAIGGLAGYGKSKSKEIKYIKLSKINSIRAKDCILPNID